VGTPAIRQDLAFLSSLLSHAQLLPGGPQRNVAKDYPRRHLAPPKERERFLTPAEADRLLSKLSGVRRMIVLCALETGMRRSEVLNLRRSEVDLRAKAIYLPKGRTKSGRARAIPISRKLLPVLEGQQTSEWVFPNPATGRPFYDPQPWFPIACAQAGLDDLHFHDLRHTFASWWVQRRGSLRALQEILGHSSAQMTKRYSHLMQDHITEEFEKVWK
jgi:integrase